MPLNESYTEVGREVGANVPVGCDVGRWVGCDDVGAFEGTVVGAGEGPVGVEVGGFVSPDSLGAEDTGALEGASEPRNSVVGS